MIQVQIDTTNQTNHVQALVPLDDQQLTFIDQAPYRASLRQLWHVVRGVRLELVKIESELPNAYGGRRDYYQQIEKYEGPLG